MAKPKKKEARRRHGAVVPDHILKYTVPAEQPEGAEGEAQAPRLLDFLFQQMPDAKRSQVKSYLAHNQVAVNNIPVKQFDTELKAGDEVAVNTTREFQVLHNRRLKLVYEDPDIIVINKGYGLLSMSHEKAKEDNAYSIVREYVKWQSPKNKIFIVHRLDKQTSGLMMLARNPQAQEAMQHNWNNMVLERKYVALAEGYIPDDEGEIRSYLAENKQFEVYSTNNPQEGKLAITRYRVLGRRNGYTLVELSLDTGRKNQIRVHLRDLGHPIAGDRKYGAKASPIHRLCLHAQTLKFAHPITRKLMDFTTPIPSNFLKIVQPYKGGPRTKPQEEIED